MSRVAFFVIGLFLISPLRGQTVTVTKQTEKIRSEQAEGFATELEGKKDAVSSAWNKFLKELGKAKASGEFQTISEPALGGTVYATGILYTTVSGSGEKSKVWIGIFKTEWDVNDIEIVNKELEQLIYRFGVKFYRDKIQAQIDEAQQAYGAVEKQTQRLVNENKSLNNKLVSNEQEKIQLERSLEENKLEHFVLLQKIENNKKSQDSVAQAGVQVKKVVEMHRERQRKVN